MLGLWSLENGGMTKQSHGRLVFFFVAKKKTRQPEGKAGTNRWPGSSTADNETCATFRRHSRRQEQDKVCNKIWNKKKEQHKQEMGQRGRNNACQEQAYVTENGERVKVMASRQGRRGCRVGELHTM